GDDVIIGRVHYEKLDLLDSESVDGLLKINCLRVPNNQFCGHLALIWLLLNKCCSFLRNVLTQFYSYSIPSQPFALNQRGSASGKSIKHPISFFRVAQHHLMRNLRNEIPPVPAKMSPGGVSLWYYP